MIDPTQMAREDAQRVRRAADNLKRVMATSASKLTAEFRRVQVSIKSLRGPGLK
jgi:hypothetical protein